MVERHIETLYVMLMVVEYADDDSDVKILVANEQASPTSKTTFSQTIASVAV